MKVSARNQLAATVTSVKSDGIMAEVVVKLAGGDEMVAVITADSVQRLGLAPGSATTVIVKSTEVMLATE
jgi:molybdopterin-binding protein